MTDFKLIADTEWRQRLSPEEYYVLREAGTEPPHVGEYTNTTTEGVYSCRACGTELFRSTEKFESHCGWPSFFSPLAGDKIIEREDNSLGMRRVEVLCVPTANLTWGTSLRVRATIPPPTCAIASTPSAWTWRKSR